MAVFDRSGEVVAGIVFHNWNPDAATIEVSAGATDPRWATRAVLRAGFGYAFGFCQAVVARQHEENTRSRRLWRSFGSTEHLIPRLRGEHAAEAVAVLTREAWRASTFMRNAHGQEQSADPA